MVFTHFTWLNQGTLLAYGHWKFPVHKQWSILLTFKFGLLWRVLFLMAVWSIWLNRIVYRSDSINSLVHEQPCPVLWKTIFYQTQLPINCGSKIIFSISTWVELLLNSVDIINEEWMTYFENFSFFEFFWDSYDMLLTYSLIV